MKAAGKHSRIFLAILALLWIGRGAISSAYRHRTEYARFTDPTGRYTAIVSYRTVLSFRPMMPGSSGDKPGFMKILDEQGGNAGEIPLPLVGLAEVFWTDCGAVVRAVGEWDLAGGTCYYWDAAGKAKVYVKGGPGADDGADESGGRE